MTHSTRKLAPLRRKNFPPARKLELRAAFVIESHEELRAESHKDGALPRAIYSRSNFPLATWNQSVGIYVGLHRIEEKEQKGEKGSPADGRGGGGLSGEKVCMPRCKERTSV